MATFPSITPTYGVRKTNRPNVRLTQFGDGYQQRVQFGLNQDPKVNPDQAFESGSYRSDDEEDPF